MKKLDNINFRNPKIEDAEEIIKFYQKMGGETTFLSFEENEYPLDEEEQKKSIEYMQKEPHCTMIIAFADKEIVGIGTIYSESKVKAKHCGGLGIVVKKAYQGMGIGTHIMSQLIEFCKTNGVTTKISLETRCDNQKAVTLYENLGFEVEGRLRNAALVEGVYHDVYVMGMML